MPPSGEAKASTFSGTWLHTELHGKPQLGGKLKPEHLENPDHLEKLDASERCNRNDAARTKGSTIAID